MRLRRAVAVLVFASAVPAHAVQTSTAAHTVLTVTGDVQTTLPVATGDLRAMPRTRVELKENGRSVAYEGVLVAELLKRAGVPLGEAMRGPLVATYVLASALDGYQVVFSLGELDPTLTGNDIIVADTVDGKPLDSSQGPLRIIAPKDARRSRSIRQRQRLEVVRLRK